MIFINHFPVIHIYFAGTDLVVSHQFREFFQLFFIDHSQKFSGIIDLSCFFIYNLFGHKFFQAARLVFCYPEGLRTFLQLFYEFQEGFVFCNIPVIEMSAPVYNGLLPDFPAFSVRILYADCDNP